MLIDLDSVELRNRRIEWIYFNLATTYCLFRTINARNVDGPDSFAINLFSRILHLNPPLSHSGRWASRDGQHCETLEPSLELCLRLEVLKMRASSQPVTEAKRDAEGCRCMRQDIPHSIRLLEVFAWHLAMAQMPSASWLGPGVGWMKRKMSRWMKLIPRGWIAAFLQSFITMDLGALISPLSPIGLYIYIFTKLYNI